MLGPNIYIETNIGFSVYAKFRINLSFIRPTPSGLYSVRHVLTVGSKEI